VTGVHSDIRCGYGTGLSNAHFEDPDGNEMYFVEAQQQWKQYDKTKAAI
jgi:hypothetical protein